MPKKINTILLIDDDPINNFINVELLKQMDIAEEIKVVVNGKEGIKCLEDSCFRTTRSPELIFLDINMPIMDGFEFLKVFNSLNFTNKPNVFIAVLTTSSNPNDFEKMEKLGIKYYFNKPLTEEKVREFLEVKNILGVA